MQLCKHMPLCWVNIFKRVEIITSRSYGYSYKKPRSEKTLVSKAVNSNPHCQNIGSKVYVHDSLDHSISPPKHILYSKKFLSLGKKKSVYNISISIYDPVIRDENLRAKDAFNTNSKFHLKTILSSQM